MTRRILIEMDYLRSPVKKNKTDSFKKVKAEGLELLNLLSRYCESFQKRVAYGNKNRMTSYYINTMEASQNRKDLETMVVCIQRLIEDSNITDKPDFILTPKSGNVILGMKVAEKMHSKCILKKCESDSATIKKPLCTTNFEGLENLIQSYEDDIPLRGIAVDCSVSSGKQLSLMVNEFNKLITEKKLNIIPVDTAYCLYRVVNIGVKDDLDNKLIINQYFCIDENKKKKIYELKKWKYFIGARRKKKNCLKEVLKQ